MAAVMAPLMGALTAGPLQVLLIEDDDADAALIDVALRSARGVPFETRRATSLRQARELLATATPPVQVLLADLSLPDSVGLDTVHACRTAAPRLPLIVLTGHDDIDFALRTLDAGAQDYLVKGAFDGDALERSIRHAIGRSRLEQRLADAEERWRFALEGAGDAVWDRNLVSGETFYSRRWKAMLGYDEHEIGDGADEWLSRVHPDDLPRVQAELQAYFEASRDGPLRSYRGERRMRHKDGHWVWIEARGMVVARDEAGRPLRMIGTHTDISQRKTAEAALRAKELAEQASRAKSEFVSRISHELRTPLNAILGFSEILQLDEAHPLAEDQLRRVERIRAAGSHLLMLINDLLDISRIEAGAMTLRIEELDADSVLDDALRDLAVLAQSRGVALLSAAPPPALPRVRADPTRLRQVVHNLVSNAIKYNRRGGRVELRLALAGERVAIVVADDGLGMSAEQLQGLFEPFNRLGREVGGEEGSGIGLVIVKYLVELMGGRIEVRSQVGQGSEFSVELPAVAPAAVAGGGRSARVAPRARPELHGHVLYIDDNEPNRTLMQAFFSLRPGLRLSMAADGSSGIAAAATERPDVVLIDIRLPDVGGVEVLHAVRALDPQRRLPCIAVSANAMPDDIGSALAAGFDAYLTKPLSAAALFEAIDPYF